MTAFSCCCDCFLLMNRLATSRWRHSKAKRFLAKNSSTIPILWHIVSAFCFKFLFRSSTEFSIHFGILRKWNWNHSAIHICSWGIYWPLPRSWYEDPQSGSWQHCLRESHQGISYFCLYVPINQLKTALKT